jgi:hypothetical protein
MERTNETRHSAATFGQPGGPMTAGIAERLDRFGIVPHDNDRQADNEVVVVADLGNVVRPTRDLPHHVPQSADLTLVEFA